MEHPAGESDDSFLQVDFDRRLRLEFHVSRITSDAGVLAYRELDDVLGLTELAGSVLSECRRGKNTRHLLTGLLRQSVFGRLAGYEDVNDADRLAHDPAMRAVVDRQGLDRAAASTSQMGRFETEWLTRDANLRALVDLSGAWIDRVYERKAQTTIVLDMDSSVSETYGAQEGTAYNGHFACMCYHPLFVFNQFGDLERCSLRPGNVHSAADWREAETSGRALPVDDEAPLLPWRCRLRQSRDLRVSGSRGLQIHNPTTCQYRSTRAHCLAPEAPGGPTTA